MDEFPVKILVMFGVWGMLLFSVVLGMAVLAQFHDWNWV